MSIVRRCALASLFATMVLLAGSVPAQAGDEVDEVQEDGFFVTARHLQEAVDDKAALGFYYDERRDDFVVVLPSSGPGSTVAAADFTFNGSVPSVKRSSTTQAAIDEVDRRIRAAAQGDKAAAHVFGSAFDLVRDVMVVTTNAPRDVVRSLSAGLPITVEHQYGTGGRNSRQYDSIPFRGGAAVTVGSITAGCSSGFTVKSRDSDDRYLLTAGHCGLVPGAPQGRPVENTGSGAYMGRFYNWFYPTRDIALIAELDSVGFYGPYIYVGNATGTVKPVSGAQEPVVGRSNYCQSGVATFEHCGHRVVDLNSQLCSYGSCTQDLVAYDQGTRPAPGDSGAPFFTYNSDRSAVIAHGIHVGSSGSLFFGEKWSLIASSQGVSIVTATP
ncbi:S1 family peptidase [Streptomyces spectabilis]|uniref:S1 family peptidase n=1 Tax=Streptomyces spectabilis TaxID=68270 RepID=UPI0033F21400